jgi:hypothetical protein
MLPKSLPASHTHIQTTIAYGNPRDVPHILIAHDISLVSALPPGGIFAFYCSYTILPFPFHCYISLPILFLAFLGLRRLGVVEDFDFIRALRILFFFLYIITKRAGV